MVEPESLDPGVVTGVPEHRILSNLFEGLTTTDPKDLSPRPGMATSWTISKDGLVYTFTLRDARWTDGNPVTAQDFVFAWERVLNPKSGAKYAQQLFHLKNGEEYNKGRSADFSQVGVKGWDSDMGRVYIIYGSPSEYQRNPLNPNENAYEIWHYLEIEGGVEFDFVDINGYGIYQLVNSTKRGEVRFENWMQEYVLPR